MPTLGNRFITGVDSAVGFTASLPLGKLARYAIGPPPPRIDRNWQLAAAGPASYSTARRKMAILRVGLGDPNGETYTIHSPKNLFATAANQMSFDQRELAVIGHWSGNSKMPERYGRSVCERTSSTPRNHQTNGGRLGSR